MNDLPDELLTEILLYLSPGDILASLLVSKKWNKCANRRSFWIQKCLRENKLNASLVEYI